MKAFIATALLAIATSSTTAHADVSTRYQFVAADTASESSICVIAAEQGYNAARDAALKAGYQSETIFCNGHKIERFARKYRDSQKLTATVQL